MVTSPLESRYPQFRDGDSIGLGARQRAVTRVPGSALLLPGVDRHHGTGKKKTNNDGIHMRLGEGRGKGSGTRVDPKATVVIVIQESLV